MSDQPQRSLVSDLSVAIHRVASFRVAPITESSPGCFVRSLIFHTDTGELIVIPIRGASADAIAVSIDN
jgi:hypothetical protein